MDNGIYAEGSEAPCFDCMHFTMDEPPWYMCAKWRERVEDGPGICSAYEPHGTLSLLRMMADLEML